MDLFYLEGDGLQKPDRFLRIRTASLAAACHFAIWSLDGKHYDMSWWVLFFFWPCFSGKWQKGQLSNNIWVSKDLGQAGVLKWNCMQRDGLFGLPFFVWNLVGATDILRCLCTWAHLCAQKISTWWMDWVFSCIRTKNAAEWHVFCSTAIESAPLYMAGQFQSIVGISGANHFRGIFPIACLVTGGFWSWLFIP